jgi:hypothetical protein
MSDAHEQRDEPRFHSPLRLLLPSENLTFSRRECTRDLRLRPIIRIDKVSSRWREYCAAAACTSRASLEKRTSEKVLRAPHPQDRMTMTDRELARRAPH